MSLSDHHPLLLVSRNADGQLVLMGEHAAQLISDRRRTSRNFPEKPPAEELGRRLLAVIVYEKRCRTGTRISLDDLEATGVGDWKMPDFKAACTYAASQGWLVVQDDVLMLTTAGLAAA